MESKIIINIKQLHVQFHLKIKEYDWKSHSKNMRFVFVSPEIRWPTDPDQLAEHSYKIASPKKRTVGYLLKEENQARAGKYTRLVQRVTRIVGKVCFKLQIVVADDRGRENRICVWSRVGR